jgi:hypothetical protein
MYVADMLYFGFEAFCKQHGLPEKDFTVMLKGLDTMATRTDTGLWELAKLADKLGIADKMLQLDAKAVLPATFLMTPRQRYPADGPMVLRATTSMSNITV